jgi:PAS domain S-box-containing protein
VWFFRDITERKIAEEALRLAKSTAEEGGRRIQFQSSLIRAIYEASPDGILVLNDEGGILSHNKRFLSVWNLSSPEMTTNALDTYETAQDNPLLSAMLQRVKYPDIFLRIILKSSMEPEANEQRGIELKDGRTLESYSSRLRREDGLHLGRVWFFRDITARRKAEQALIESENHLRILADCCPIGIWAVNAEGRTRFINRTFREFVGWTTDQVEREKWESIIHPDDAPEYTTVFNDALQRRLPFKSHARFLRGDGQWRWATSYGTPLLSPEGTFQGFVGAIEDVTERLEADRALRNSEEMFRQLAENIQEVFWMMDAAGSEFLYISPAYERIWGAQSVNPISRPADWMKNIHADYRALSHDTFLRQLKGESTDIEYRAVAPDGEEKWIRNRAFPVLDECGELIKIAGVAEDITARKHAEILLKQTSDRLMLALRAGIVGVWDWDIASNTMVWDEQMSLLYGIAPIQCHTRLETWLKSLHPDDMERVLEEFNAALRGEVEFNTEFRVIWPNGNVRHIRALALVTWGDAGNAIRMVGTNWDITDQMQAEELLKQTADRLKLAVRAGRVGIFSYDYLKDRWTWDDQEFQLHGIQREDFRGTFEAWLELLHPEDRERVRGEAVASAKGEKEFDSEFRAIWPDGSIHYIRGIAVVERDAHGEATLALGTNWDITAQKRAADALLASNRQLEQETTRANGLAIEAEKATEAKSVFLANMSHEIRTPMNGVLGMVGLLLDTELTAEQRRYAEIVRASSESLLQILNDILDFSKIEAQKLELESIDFDLQFLLEYLVSILSVAAQAKGIELRCVAEPSVPRLLCGDPGRLRQILINLANNAIKFTESGKVMVRVALKEESESDCVLRFSVLDTGIGIAADKIRILFDKFSQAEVSTTRKYGGTGLGLAISKLLVELMGGEIGVKSQPGKGSEFWFTVTLKRNSGLDTESELAQSESPVTHPLTAKILVAEDNLTNREVALSMLWNLGLRADAVANGAEAIRALESTPYDLVLMDMRMPVMDGIEATRHIRNPQSAVLNHDIPIIALTANAMQRDRQICLAAGMNDFVPKPIIKTVLRKAINKWLLEEDDPIPDEQITASITAEDATRVFDREGMLERLEGDEQLAQVISKVFLEDIPQQIQALKNLVKSGDMAGSARQAHSIRGASASVGGECLRKVADEIEKAADSGNLDGVNTRMNDLDTQFLLLRDAIKNHRDAGE